MKYTKEQQEQFCKFLETKRSQGCVFCGDKGPMVVNEPMYQLLALSNSHELKGYNMMPLVAMVCPKCGHVELFNAMTAGIIDEDHIREQFQTQE